MQKKTYDKHNVIAEALIALGVDRDTAFEDSCKIEHCLSDESFSAIKAYLASIKKIVGVWFNKMPSDFDIKVRFLWSISLLPRNCLEDQRVFPGVSCRFGYFSPHKIHLSGYKFIKK